MLKRSASRLYAGGIRRCSCQARNERMRRDGNGNGNASKYFTKRGVSDEEALTIRCLLADDGIHQSDECVVGLSQLLFDLSSSPYQLRRGSIGTPPMSLVSYCSTFFPPRSPFI